MDPIVIFKNIKRDLLFGSKRPAVQDLGATAWREIQAGLGIKSLAKGRLPDQQSLEGTIRES